MCAVLWITALTLRLVYLWQIYDAPFFDLLIGDALAYHLWAVQIANGDWMGSEVFYQAPLYPYFLATIYALLSNDLIVVRVVQSLLGATACVLLALAGRTLFQSCTTGLIAGAVLAFYPTTIFFDGLIQKSSIDLVLVTLLLWLVCRMVDQPNAWRCLAAGGVLGLLGLVRENALLWIPVLVLWVFLQFRDRPVRQRSGWVLVFTVSVTAVLMPVAARNAVVAGQFHLTTSQLGSNFYIGNHEGASGRYEPLRYGRGEASVERLDAVHLAEQDLGRRLTAGQVSRYWLGRTVQYIRTEPIRWLELMGLKVLLICNAVEIADTEGQYHYGEYSWLLRGLGSTMHFGVLLPAAVFGICISIVSRPDFKRFWVLWLLGLTYLFSVVLFYVSARYRYPIVPILVLLASSSAVRTTQLVKQRQLKPLLIGMVFTVAAIVVTNWPLISMLELRATGHHNMGAALALKESGLELAIEQFDLAVSLKPDYAKAWNSRGTVLTKLGHMDEAMASFNRAWHLRTDFSDPYYNAGVLMQEAGRDQEAKHLYREAIRVNPISPHAHNNYGVLLARSGQLEQAIRHYQSALGIDPSHIESHNNLGVAMARQGKSAAAAQHFIRATELDPDYLDAHINAAQALGVEGELEQAAIFQVEVERLQKERASDSQPQGVAERKDTGGPQNRADNPSSEPNL